MIMIYLPYYNHYIHQPITEKKRYSPATDLSSLIEFITRIDIQF
jgi:hypothetical protein